MVFSLCRQAAQGGNTEDCESLLDIGADPEWRNPEGDTPLLVSSTTQLDRHRGGGVIFRSL